MSKTNTLRNFEFTKPRYWGWWMLFGFLRLTSQLSFNGLWRLSQILGPVFYWLAFPRRRTALKNLRIAFPDWSEAKRHTVAKAHFVSITMGFFEAYLSWSKPKADYKDWIKAINGLEHLEKPLAEGQGVMLLSAHFTTLEFAGFLLSNYFDFSVTYRPQKNLLFEAKMVEGRSRNYQQAIAKQEIKTFIRCLKKGEIVWYAPDQAYRRKGKVQVTFFDHPCWVPNAILQLARMGDAKVVPFFSHRTPEGYVLDILEPMDLSEKSDTEITQHYHHLIEDYARKHPEQYLWTHRKYKGFE